MKHPGLWILEKSSKTIYFPIDLRFFGIRINGQPALERSSLGKGVLISTE
jgi:hypothetical protein